MQGKILAALTSMVLHGNHLGYFTYVGIYLLLFLFFKRMCVRERIFIIIVLTKDWGSYAYVPLILEGGIRAP